MSCGNVLTADVGGTRSATGLCHGTAAGTVAAGKED